MEWTQFFNPIFLSLKVTIASSVLAFIAGIGAAWFMTRYKFRGQAIVETILIIPLVLPPTVIGFILLIIFGRRGFVGSLFELLTGGPIVFTWIAAVIASVTVAFPLVYQIIRSGFASIDKSLVDMARSMGAGKWQVFRHITLPASTRFLISGCVLGFARGIGEFGATLMIAGNIPGRTQTIPSAIYTAVDSGNIVFAWYWCIAIIVLSFLLLLSLNRPPRHVN